MTECLEVRCIPWCSNNHQLKHLQSFIEAGNVTGMPAACIDELSWRMPPQAHDFPRVLAYAMYEYMSFLSHTDLHWQHASNEIICCHPELVNKGRFATVNQSHVECLSMCWPFGSKTQ